MTLQGVNAALPCKAVEESALLHKSKQGNGQNAGNGHLVGPKTKAAAALQTAPDSSSMSAAKVWALDRGLPANRPAVVIRTAAPR